METGIIYIEQNITGLEEYRRVFRLASDGFIEHTMVSAYERDGSRARWFVFHAGCNPKNLSEYQPA